MVLVRAVEALVLVEYGLFALIDAAGLDPGISPFNEPPGSALCDGDEGWVCFESGVSYHRAAVRVEVHSVLPPDQVNEWEASGATKFSSLTGSMMLWTGSSGSAGEPVEVGEPGSWFNLRAYSRGRSTALEARMTSGKAVGAEQWLVQIWLSDE